MSEPVNYLDAYWYRVNKMGSNHKARELNASIYDFNKYLLEHPSSETVVVEGEEQLASIISDRQNENKMTKKVLTLLTSNLSPGKIMLWKSAKWLAYFKEKTPNEAYLTHLVVQCNNTIRWISDYGVIRELPCYVVGNMIGSIKNNFRTWNGTITPLPNQFLDMLIPYEPDLEIGKKFLMSGRAWIIVDYDITSVPGLMYVSLTEDKIDRLDDNTLLEIAEYDNLNRYRIELTEEDIEVVLGVDYNIYPRVIYEGQIVSNATLQYEIVDETVVSVTYINGGVKISGIEVGDTVLRISLLQEPSVMTEVSVSVVEVATKNPQYILSGPDFIRLGRTGTYTLYASSSTEEIISIVAFSVNKQGYVSGLIANGQLSLTANENNVVGDIIVSVEIDGVITPVASKTISIRSLW